jgi:pimeloyl-ACP methyl ester carboxylesterase
MDTTIVQASDGVKLAAHRLGSGPPLYALHGGPASDHRSFGDYLSPITDCRELLLLDQRGCGESEDAPVESYTIERLSQDIEDIRGSLQHEQIDLLAHSFGGVIAVDYARRWPERVRAPVFVDAAVSGWYGPLVEPRGWPLWFRAMTFRGDFTEFHLKHEVANDARREEVRALLAEPTRHDPARFQPLAKEGQRRVRLEELAKQVPVFGMYGKQSRRFLGDARYLRRVGGNIVFIDNAGHFPFVEQPQSFHNALRSFLA